MPGLFIDVRISPSVERDALLADRLAEICPVDIFSSSPSGVEIFDEHLDECVLCYLCTEAAPRGAVRIVKLYEN